MRILEVHGIHVPHKRICSLASVGAGLGFVQEGSVGGSSECMLLRRACVLKMVAVIKRNDAVKFMEQSFVFVNAHRREHPTSGRHYVEAV